MKKAIKLKFLELQFFKYFKNKSFLIKIIIGTIPIIPVGYILYETGLVNQLRNLEVVGWMSLIFGILLYVSDRTKITKKIDTITLSSTHLLFLKTLLEKEFHSKRRDVWNYAF